MENNWLKEFFIGATVTAIILNIITGCDKEKEVKKEIISPPAKTATIMDSPSDKKLSDLLGFEMTVKAEKLYNAGLALEDKNKNEEAIEKYKEALELKIDTTYFTRLGELLEKEEKYLEAKDLYKKALDLNPRWFWKAFARSTFLTGDYEETIKILEEFKNKPDINFGMCWPEFFVDNKGEEEIKLYTLATQLHPKEIEYWLILGEKQESQKHYKEALKSFKKAAEINPKRHYAWIQQARIAEKLGNIEETIKVYEKASKLYFPTKNRYRLGNLYLETKQYEKAAKMLLTVPEFELTKAFGDEDPEPAHYPDAKTKAITALNHLLEENPNKAETWKMLGDCYHPFIQTEKKIKAYRRAVELEPDNKEYKNLLNQSLGMKKTIDEKQK